MATVVVEAAMQKVHASGIHRQLEMVVAGTRE